MKEEKIEKYKWPCGMEITFINCKEKTFNPPYTCPIHQQSCPFLKK